MAHVHLTVRHLCAENIAQADKGRNKDVCGPLIETLGCVYLLDDAIVHHGDSVGDGQGLLLIMGDIDGGDPNLPLDALDDVAHLHAQLRIQIGQRFVH